MNPATDSTSVFNTAHKTGENNPSRKSLTPEEIRVLQECNADSFYYRCLPLGCVLIGVTKYLVQIGKLNPNPKFGAIPKCISAGFVAFVLGKLSYSKKCREKILKLEGSPLAEAIRYRKDMPLLSPSQFGDKSAEKHETDNVQTFDHSQDKLPIPVMNADTNTYYAPLDSPAPSNDHVSYENLREKNRSDYNKKFVPSNSSRSAAPEIVSKSKPVRTNAYGDEIEED